MSIKRKFMLAAAAYVALGLLAWQTLSDQPIRLGDLEISLRAGTLCVLGLFALRTLLYFWRVRIEDARAGEVEEKHSPM